MQITQQKTDALVPYARNAKRHDSGQLPAKVNAGSQSSAGNGKSIKKRKGLSMYFHFLNRYQSSVRHVMMIWAKRYQVFQLIAAAMLSGYQVVNRSDVMKPAKDAFTTVPHPCRHFPAACYVLPCSARQCRAVALSAALLGAKASLLVSDHRNSYGHRLSASDAWVMFSLVKRVQNANSFAAKLIAAFSGAILSIFDVRHRFKDFFAMLAFVNGRQPSPSSAIMTAHKHFPLGNRRSASAFARY
jgi:hypothetical protein